MGSLHGVFRSDEPAIGDRVVVRRILPDTPGHLSDVIGHVISVDPLQIRPQSVGGFVSDAPVIEIPPQQVKILKKLSPRRIRNSDIRALEHATARAFPGIEHRWVGPWLLRAGDGVTERSNSAAPLGPTAAFEQVPLAEICEFYESYELPARILIPERIGNPVLRRLAAIERAGGGAGAAGGSGAGVSGAGAGAFGGSWRLGPEIIVMVRDLLGGVEAEDEELSALLHRLREEQQGIRFQIDDQPDDEWLSLYHFRGKPLPTKALELLRTRIEGQMAFGRLVNETGETLAITRGTLTRGGFEDPFDADDPLLLGYSAVEVTPQWRRRGLGTRLGAEMMAWGAACGAAQVYLQVIASNKAGIGLYHNLGFREHHRHRYAEQITSE